jgi:hypothetical protein
MTPATKARTAARAHKHPAIVCCACGRIRRGCHLVQSATYMPCRAHAAICRAPGQCPRRTQAFFENGQTRGVDCVPLRDFAVGSEQLRNRILSTGMDIFFCMYIKWRPRRSSHTTRKEPCPPCPEPCPPLRSVPAPYLHLRTRTRALPGARRSVLCAQTCNGALCQLLRPCGFCHKSRVMFGSMRSSACLRRA